MSCVGGTLFAVLATGVLLGECRFEEMLRVVYRDVTPGVPEDSFAAKPKTLYRVGTRYGRVEELPDLKAGVHGLMIVNEPHLWIVNLANKRARHVVDRGPTTMFRAPIFWTKDMPGVLRDFEFGCEMQFVRGNGASSPESVEVDGIEGERYEINVGKYHIALLVGEKDRRLRRVVFEEGGKVTYSLQYESWMEGLVPNLKLFEVPEGTIVREEAE